jgi:hypothetical protein
MSFFDEGDEPTRTSSPPRSARPRPRRPATGGGGRPPRGDDATLRNRRLAALGVLLVIFVVLVVGVQSCRSSARDNKLKNYNRDVSAVIQDSDAQVAKPFFRLLNSGSTQAADLQGQTNQLRLVAEEDARRARGFSVPGNLGPAQADLLLALDLRAEALAKIADALPGALADGADNRQTAENAVNRIAGQMRAFDASDVVYSQRTAPYIQQALNDAGISGQRIAQSSFLPDARWLIPDNVAGALGAQRAGGGRGANATPAPGLHGHGLTSVGVNGTTLQPPPAVNRLKAGASVVFTVAFQNQGDNDETGVVVRVTVRGAGKPVTAKKTVNQTKAKQPATVDVPLTSAPPIGQPVTIDVVIDAVPGEKNTTNNKQSYTAIFSR